MEQGVEEDEDWCGIDPLSSSLEPQTRPYKGKGVEGGFEDWYSIDPLGSSLELQTHQNLEQGPEVEEGWCDEEDDDEN